MDGLEKIFEKLGVFSILSALVPGLAIGADLYLFIGSLKRIKIAFSDYKIVFVILSMLLGIVFFELGCWMFSCLFRQDKILFRTINSVNSVKPKEKLKDKQKEILFFQKSVHLKLCKYEYDEVKKYVDAKMHMQINDNNEQKYTNVNWEGYRVYNYCKHKVKNHETNNSIVAMSRTLFAYFIISEVLFVTCHFLIAESSYLLWFIIIHFILAIIFLIRTIRNYELMYATVIKEFYQSII